jgi:hypothetical protein
MDDQICKRKEKAGYSPRVRNEFVSFEKNVENEARLGQKRRGQRMTRGHRTRVWHPSSAQIWHHDIIVGSIYTAIGIQNVLVLLFADIQHAGW